MRQSGYRRRVLNARKQSAGCRTALAAAALLAMLAGGDARATGLFEETAVLPLVLEFPVQTLMRDKLEQNKLPATLHYAGPDGVTTSLPLEVRARGRTRLELCRLPPLRLDFKRSTVKGTLFEGQQQLKLVTHCQVRLGDKPRYRDYVLLEQRIYEAYRLITPLSFRTRMLSADYVDPGERMSKLDGPAFLIEDFDALAERVEMRKVRQPSLGHAEMDAAHLNLLELFHFMIGNTDWSAQLPSDGDQHCCHNGRVLGPTSGDGGLVNVPFDFDQSGLINTEYAAVNPAVNVRYVWQRIYRGYCLRNEHVPASIARLRELRPQIEALFQPGELSDWSSRRALRYLRDFYEILENPAEVQKRIYDVCRSDA